MGITRSQHDALRSQAMDLLPVGQHVLVTGSRDYNEPTAVEAVLYGYSHQMVPLHIVHGRALGLDTIANAIATENMRNGWTRAGYPADWKKHGRKAGPKRNKQMLDEEVIDVCFGWPLPGSIGTWDCLTRAFRRDIPSYFVTPKYNLEPMAEEYCVEIWQ